MGGGVRGEGRKRRRRKEGRNRREDPSEGVRRRMDEGE